jgi:hypothetical protein
VKSHGFSPINQSIYLDFLKMILHFPITGWCPPVMFVGL